MKEKSNEAEGKKPFILVRAWNRIKNLVITQIDAKMMANELYRMSRQIDNISLQLKFPFGGEPGVMLERIALYINNQKKELEFHRAENTKLHRRVSDLMQTDSGKSEIERQIEAFNAATRAMNELQAREDREAASQSAPAPVTDVMSKMAVQESHDDLAQRIMNFKPLPARIGRR